MSVKEVLDVAIQITSALAAAHSAGIVHRDVKPENVMIRPDGYVKVLDFGLAKLMGRRATAKEDGTPSVLSNIDTDPGKRMGTLRYMSPEQALGLDVDARSDIFNLGIVLYEMVTGRLAFDGSTAAAVIAAILETEPPPLLEVAPGAPAELQRIISKALSKDTEHRYKTSEEILRELRAVKQTLEREGRLAYLYTSLSTLLWQRPRFAMALLLTLVVCSSVWIRERQGRLQEAHQQSTYHPLNTTSLAEWRNASKESLSDPRFSPDGTRIAYSLIQGGHPEAIFVKEINGNATPVSNDQWNNWNPVWSPDGQRLAFLSERAGQIGIWFSSHRGGTQTLLKVIGGGLPILKRWSNDGTRVFYELKNNLFAIDLASAIVTQLTSFEPVAADPKNFGISPNEDRVVYRDQKNGNFDIWTKPLDGGTAIQLTDDTADDSNPCWLHDGERIAYTSLRAGHYQVCLAYLDRRNPVQITNGEGSYRISDVSSDSSRILYTAFRDASNIFGVKVDSGDEFEVTSGLAVKCWPDVSPDGRTLAFQALNESNALEEFVKSPIVITPLISPEQEIPLVSNGYDPKWLPDGGVLSFLRVSDSTSIQNIWTINISTREEQQVTKGGVAVTSYSMMPFNRIQTGGHSWSADGSRVIYCSDKSSVSDVWISSADHSLEKNITKNSDPNLVFSCPLWSPDNTRIAFLSFAIPAAHKAPIWSVVIVIDGDPRVVYSSESYLRLVGWSSARDDVVIASTRDMSLLTAATLSDVGILRVSALGHYRAIMNLKSAYADNVRLSPDGRIVSFTSRQDGNDNVWVVQTNGPEARKLTRNNNQRLYYSSPAWSPDGRTLYYGKQERWRVISMIEGFE